MLQDDTNQYDTDTRRHWHAPSEQYTGADSLLTILSAGGQIMDNTIYYQQFPLSVSRTVRVFHVYVEEQGRVHHMQVIDTPCLWQVLNHHKKAICRLESRTTLQSLELTH